MLISERIIGYRTDSVASTGQWDGRVGSTGQWDGRVASTGQWEESLTPDDEPEESDEGTSVQYNEEGRRRSAYQYQ